MSVPGNRSGLPRTADIMVSLIALIITAPLLALSALAVLLSSPGPIIFRQGRVGLRGKVFQLYKLRTMRVENGGPEVTASHDGRITSVGRLLRWTKLDELPELLNVIKGDMSLVGPRPEVPRYVNSEDPMWKQVLETRPGITDPMTIRLRNEEKLLAQVPGDKEWFYLNILQPFKLRGYLEYLCRRNWWSDVKVLANTVLCIIVSSPERQPTFKDITGLNPPYNPATPTSGSDVA